MLWLSWLKPNEQQVIAAFVPQAQYAKNVVTFAVEA